MSDKNEFVQLTLNIGSDVPLSQVEVNAIIDQLQSKFRDLRAGPIDIIHKNVSSNGTPKGEPFIMLGVAALQFVVPKLIEVIYDLIKQRQGDRMKVVAQLGSEQIRMDSLTDTHQFANVMSQIKSVANVEQVPDRKFALLIGTTKYRDNRLNQLTSPEMDVRHLADILRDPDIGGYDDVELLLNETSGNLQQAIEQFYQRKANTDLLLLYYSGHGIKSDEGKLYLAAENTNLETIRSTTLSSDFVIGEMDLSKSERQVLILDCCYSGAFLQGAKNAKLGTPVGAVSVFRGNGYGRVIMTASDKTQVAWEGQQIMGQVQKSVFTEHLIAGLQSGEADNDRDGWVGLDELYKFVYDRMVKRTQEQTPLINMKDMKGSIYLARNPRPNPEALPDEIQRSLRSPYQYVREGAVNELCQLFRSAQIGMALAARKELENLVNDDSQRISQIVRQALGLDVAGGFWLPPETKIPADHGTPDRPAPEEPDTQTRQGEPAVPWWEVIKAPPGTRISGNSKSGPDQASMISEALNMFGDNSPFSAPQNQVAVMQPNASFTPIPLTGTPVPLPINHFSADRRALLFGILSMVLFVIPLLPIIGIVVGSQATKSNPQNSQAKTGLVLSWIALGLQLILFVIVVIQI